MSNALTPILAAKQDYVAQCKRRIPLAELERRVADMAPARGFAASLMRAADAGRFGLIAEMKRFSPSGGQIRPVFDPAAIAVDYAAGGAACLSVLTDSPFFGGLDSDLQAARDAVSLPALRKDFMIDPYQIVESRALGADCILLIAAALDDAAMRLLAAETARLGMDALIEVHDEDELERALRLDTSLIGINNRDLKRLETDLATFERLAPLVPRDRLMVAESGLRSTADLKRMADSGAKAFLVGESLLRQHDMVAATRALLGENGEC